MEKEKEHNIWEKRELISSSLIFSAPRNPLYFLSSIFLVSGYILAQKPPGKLKAFHHKGIQMHLANQSNTWAEQSALLCEASQVKTHPALCSFEEMGELIGDGA